jgi:hypothetical protein
MSSNGREAQVDQAGTGPAPRTQTLTGDVMKAVTCSVLAAATLAFVAPEPAAAGSSTDAALALGAFAVFNQLVHGDTVLHDIFGGGRHVVPPPPRVVYRPAPPVVHYAPPPVVHYAPPPVVHYAPPPVVHYAAPRVVYVPVPHRHFVPPPRHIKHKKHWKHR